MTMEPAEAAASPSVLFFDRTYDEAMALLVEARDYIARDERRDRSGLDLAGRLRMACETLRMTTRIAHMMAWLLAQKAIAAGETTPDAIVTQYDALAGIEVCMETVESPELPPRLLILLDRSRRLYQRVARLDDMLRRGPGQGPVPLVSA